MRILPLILGLIAVSPAFSESPGGPPPAEPAQFARVLDDAEGRPEALQVAIVTYSSRDAAGSFTVDLVSAIHIGDRSYYADLNDRFTDYDALLFELVFPEQPGFSPAHAAGAGFVSGMQIGMKNMLGLAFQLEEIDYGAPNFVHADLTSESLATSMSERGESLYVYFWRLLIASIEDYSRDPLGTKRSQRMSGAVGAEPEYALRIAMAYEMVDAVRAGDLLAGPDGSAVIDARNEHAIDVLRKQLDDGAQRVGIFYGIAHMPDFEQRLLGDLALTRTGVEWVDAWRLAGGDQANVNRP